MRTWSPGTPLHRWEETTARARAMLSSPELAGREVAVLGEIQLMLPEHTAVRNRMHEMYKVHRAETAVLLYTDFARSVGLAESEMAQVMSEEPASLWLAACRGHRPAVERFVTQPDVDLDRRRGRRSPGPSRRHVPPLRRSSARVR